MSIFLGAFMMIFFAEMGDKSQLMAVSLSSCYRARTVLLGVFVSTCISNGIAVILGTYIGNMIDFTVVTAVASLAFLGFGIWTLYEKNKNDKQEHIVECGWGSFLSIAVMFTLAEMGDKTQIATAAYAANYGAPLLTFLGVLAGMMLADALGIYLGYRLRAKSSQEKLKLLSSFMFFGLGVATLMSSIFLIEIKIAVLTITAIFLFWYNRYNSVKLLTYVNNLIKSN